MLDWPVTKLGQIFRQEFYLLFTSFKMASVVLIESVHRVKSEKFRFGELMFETVIDQKLYIHSDEVGQVGFYPLLNRQIEL